MKVTGKVVTTKQLSYSNAAKYSYRFTISDNKASTALDILLHRTTESLNNLVGLREQCKTRSRCESDVEVVGEDPRGEKAEKRERQGIAGNKRKKGKKSEDFEQVIVKTERSPDGDVEKRRKRKGSQKM